MEVQLINTFDLEILIIVSAMTLVYFICIFIMFCFYSSMNMFMSTGLRSLILTSGTLAPLKPLITELELQIDVRLENPHIVTGEQICVKIVPAGPDKEPLNCNFHNR